MFAHRFVNHLDPHTDALTHELLQKITRSGRCSELLRRVPANEQRESMHETYRHMTEWLLNEGAAVDEEYYVSLGIRRSQQGVSFNEFLFAVCTARQYFCEYIEEETLLEQPADCAHSTPAWIVPCTSQLRGTKRTKKKRTSILLHKRYRPEVA